MAWRSRAHVQVRQERGAFVVVVSGEFDADEQDLLAAAWDEADERGLPVTVLDLSAVTFADSSFLSNLLQARRRHRAASRRLVLVGPLQPRVHMLLTMTKVLEHFEVSRSLDEALSSGPPGGTSDDG
ncbi:STAS domain-containing protein [Streptomyces sp. NPDC049916]|uniref:STAS domain-containing protein n=1 Tax=unclassified Streptomyces TaxID=2593676 RepID=UPI0034488850